MTLQELFDIVLNGIRAQGGSSIEANKCMYRHINGRKCAAGHVLKDEHYRPRLEGGMVFSHPVEYALRLSGVPDHLMTPLRQLQVIHDDAAIQSFTDALFFMKWEPAMKLWAEDQESFGRVVKYTPPPPKDDAAPA